MREYAQVWPGFWTGETGRAITALANAGDLQPQRVALYLMTCKSATFSGLFYMPLPLLVHELGGIDVEGAQKALRSLSDLGFAHFDEALEQVWLVNAATFNIGLHPKLTDNRVIGLQRELEGQRKSPFYAAFLEHYAHLFPSPNGSARQPSGASPSAPATKGVKSPLQGSGVSGSDPIRSRTKPERDRAGARTHTRETGIRPGAAEQTETPRELVDDEMLTPTLLGELFHETWYRLRKVPPPSSELERSDRLADLAQRVTDTAAARGMPPVPLLRSAIEEWAGGELNARELNAPLSCFATAWGSIVESITPAPPPLDQAEPIRREAGEAMRRGDTARFNELQDQLRAMNGGRRHAVAR
jgi:hypothetical protein